MRTMFVRSSRTVVPDSRRGWAAQTGAMSGDEDAPDGACCMICGCPSGPCSRSEARPAWTARVGCPFERGVAAAPQRVATAMHPPLSIATASLLLVAGFLYLAV